MEWSGWEKLGNLTTYDEGEKGQTIASALPLVRSLARALLGRARFSPSLAIYHVMNRGDRRGDISWIGGLERWAGKKSAWVAGSK